MFIAKSREITTFLKLLDCVSETAADEMRAAYKAGFKDGATISGLI
ncbi:MAG TPA: hypothetical protein PLH83_14045 [Ruminococcus sp.]|nr:hypothetical protein [Ruminococcus sp.]